MAADSRPVSWRHSEVGQQRGGVFSQLRLAVGSVLIWAFESGVKGGDIHGYGDAVFFTAVQLLTISSAITNPLTTGGKVVDVALEMWAIFVVTGVAGSFASFSPPGIPAE